VTDRIQPPLEFTVLDFLALHAPGVAACLAAAVVVSWIISRRS